MSNAGVGSSKDRLAHVQSACKPLWAGFVTRLVGKRARRLDMSRSD